MLWHNLAGHSDLGQCHQSWVALTLLAAALLAAQFLWPALPVAVIFQIALRAE